MAKSILEIIVGDLDEKRDYRQFMKRVKALPKNYRNAFKKIQNYMYNYGMDGCNMAMYADLLDLFETGAAEEKNVSDIIGNDAAKFCEELLQASNINRETMRDKLNQEIIEYFNKEGNGRVQ